MVCSFTRFASASQAINVASCFALDQLAKTIQLARKLLQLLANGDTIFAADRGPERWIARCHASDVLPPAADQRARFRFRHPGYQSGHQVWHVADRCQVGVMLEGTHLFRLAAGQSPEVIGFFQLIRVRLIGRRQNHQFLVQQRLLRVLGTRFFRSSNRVSRHELAGSCRLRRDRLDNPIFRTTDIGDQTVIRRSLGSRDHHRGNLIDRRRHHDHVAIAAGLFDRTDRDINDSGLDQSLAFLSAACSSPQTLFAVERDASPGPHSHLEDRRQEWQLGAANRGIGIVS